MDDLAEAAGITKAAIYYYYASKSTILYDILTRAARATIEAVQPTGSISAHDESHLCTVGLIRAAAANPHAAAVYLQESPYLNEWITDHQLNDIRYSESLVRRRIREIIDRGVTTSEFRDCDSEIVTLGYLGMISGAQRWLIPDITDGADRVASEFNRVLLRSLSHPAASRRSGPPPAFQPI